VNKLFESAGIALDAIWASKLRSLMTVLGNIVAVTSIIAVVSLIQGLNASVTSAIMNQAGADSFSIQQFPITRSDEEFEKVRSNPRVSLADGDEVKVDEPKTTAGGK
jgi:putative ABC transport system permease protein